MDGPAGVVRARRLLPIALDRLPAGIAIAVAGLTGTLLAPPVRAVEPEIHFVGTVAIDGRRCVLLSAGRVRRRI